MLQEARVTIQFDNKSVPFTIARVMLKRYINDSRRYYIPDYYLNKRNPKKADEAMRAIADDDE